MAGRAPRSSVATPVTGQPGGGDGAEEARVVPPPGWSTARSDPRSHQGYRTAKRRMFSVKGTVCHLCGHGGARIADHEPPLKTLPAGHRISWENLYPAHGGGEYRCPQCGLNCNGIKGDRSLAWARQRIAEINEQAFNPRLEW